MERASSIFEGCCIGRLRIDLLFLYNRSATIHSQMITDEEGEKYRITVELFINNENIGEFEW